MIEAIKMVWKLRRLMKSAVWAAAQDGVTSTMAKPHLTVAAEREPQIAFCPLCGQIPDGDRRMDHARSVAMGALTGAPIRRFELDTAIVLHYFLRKS